MVRLVSSRVSTCRGISRHIIPAPSALSTTVSTESTTPRISFSLATSPTPPIFASSKNIGEIAKVSKRARSSIRKLPPYKVSTPLIAVKISASKRNKEINSFHEPMILSQRDFPDDADADFLMEVTVAQIKASVDREFEPKRRSRRRKLWLATMTSTNGTGGVSSWKGRAACRRVWQGKGLGGRVLP